MPQTSPISWIILILMLISIILILSTNTSSFKTLNNNPALAGRNNWSW